MGSKSEKLEFLQFFSPIFTMGVSAKLNEFCQKWKFIISTSPLQLNHSAMMTIMCRSVGLRLLLNCIYIYIYMCICICICIYIIYILLGRSYLSFMRLEGGLLAFSQVHAANCRRYQPQYTAERKIYICTSFLPQSQKSSLFDIPVVFVCFIASSNVRSHQREHTGVSLNLFTASKSKASSYHKAVEYNIYWEGKSHS